MRICSHPSTLIHQQLNVVDMNMNGLGFRNDSPGLLVSVRSAAEARIALAGGADVVDVKEPSRGSLGAADAEAVAAVVTAVGSQCPVSAAAGELLDLAGGTVGTPGIAFAKLGLAGCQSCGDWPARWRAAIGSWPASVQPVAVVYADWRLADAPPPDDVLAEANAIGCPALLIDTWGKTRGSLFAHWPVDEVAQFCRRVRAERIAVVLAGSLAGAELAVAVRCQPDLIAVRGAVCDGDRTGVVQLDRVRTVRAAVRSEPAASENHLSLAR